MYDQDSQDPETGNSQDGNDLMRRVNGLMGTANRRLSERDAAIAERDAARAELEALRTQLDSTPETPYRQVINPMKQRVEPGPLEELKTATWSDFGIEPVVTLGG